MSIEQGVKDIIAETLSIGADEIEMEKSLTQSLGVDSTEMVDLRVALEKKFGIKLQASEITKDSRPKDIVALIETKKPGA